MDWLDEFNSETDREFTERLMSADERGMLIVEGHSTIRTEADCNPHDALDDFPSETP